MTVRVPPPADDPGLPRNGPPRFAGMTAGAFPEGAGTILPPDTVERLRRLTILHQAGAMTDEEFAERRAALLRGPD